MKSRYQVFVSSTYKDLKNQRQRVANVIQRRGWFPAGMELFPAGNKKAWEYIKDAMVSSHAYILIIGGRYGHMADGEEISYTEKEYEYAKKLHAKNNLSIHVLIWDESETDYLDETDDKGSEEYKKLQDFKQKVKEYSYKEFDDDAQLVTELNSALDAFADEALPGLVDASDSPDHKEMAELQTETAKLQKTINRLEEQLNQRIFFQKKVQDEHEFIVQCNYVSGHYRQEKRYRIITTMMRIWQRLAPSMQKTRINYNTVKKKINESLYYEISTTSLNGGFSLSNAQFPDENAYERIINFFLNSGVIDHETVGTTTRYFLTNKGEKAALDGAAFPDLSK